MKQLILSFGVLIFIAACQSPLTEGLSKKDSTSAGVPDSPTDTGWISLFDGHSLKGWHTYGKSAPGNAWSIDSAGIHLQPGTKNGYQTSGGGDLVSDDVFGHFDLKLERRIGKKANSGIPFYMQEENKAEIMGDNGKLDMYLNGVHIISTILWDEKWKGLIAGSKFKDMPGFGTFKSGHIALQDHGEEVWYRHIEIKKI
jgi:hypothetical protein